MVRILFVCLGNICRSPMAEFVFRNLAETRGVGDRFEIASAATSTEEIGNPVHRGTRNKLAEYGISVAGKCARQMTRRDYDEYDYLIGMEHANLRNMLHIAGGDPKHKLTLLLDLAPKPRDIADPWYTGDFDATYRDVLEGCTLLLDRLIEEGL